MKDKLATRNDRPFGPDHHIWDNNGTWWCHLSLARKRGPSKRIRFSLHTSNRREARERRDLIMKATDARAKELLRGWRAAR